MMADDIVIFRPKIRNKHYVDENGNVDLYPAELKKNDCRYYYGDSDSHGIVWSYVFQYVAMHLTTAYAYYVMVTVRNTPTFYATFFYSK